jgi:hypothetical protein
MIANTILDKRVEAIATSLDRIEIGGIGKANIRIRAKGNTRYNRHLRFF